MTAPGWYPDPHTGQQRYFDGTNWGPTAPPPPPPAETAAPRYTINYGFALLAVFSLLGTLFFGIPMFAAEDGSGIGAGLGVLWMLWGGMWTIIWAAFAFQHTLRGKFRR